jgi:hypothetical protein
MMLATVAAGAVFRAPPMICTSRVSWLDGGAARAVRADELFAAARARLR